METTTWHRHDESIHVYITDDGKCIAHTCVANINAALSHPRIAAVGDYIVLACSLHEELVETLRGLLLSGDAIWEDDDLGHDWPSACATARAVLAKCEKARQD